MHHSSASCRIHPNARTNAPTRRPSARQNHQTTSHRLISSKNVNKPHKQSISNHSRTKTRHITNLSRHNYSTSPYDSLKESHQQLPRKVTIVEVGPRDGLQNQPQILTDDVKAEFINRLNRTGLQVIEAGSFVSPKWVPQMAGSASVLSKMTHLPNVHYPVLTPNMQGYERAMAAGCKDIAVFAAASEGFSRHNINCTIEESLRRFEPVLDAARRDGVRVRGYVSTVLGCPYDGEVPVENVAEVASWLYQHGCYEISLGDTIGVGTPGKTRVMLDAVLEKVPREHLAVHMHDTFGQALSNIVVSLEQGISVVDSAAAGLGGCPYAGPTASGNVGTEDVVYMLQGMGIDTGVDMEKLLDASEYIANELGIQPSSKTCRALLAKRAALRSVVPSAAAAASSGQAKRIVL